MANHTVLSTYDSSAKGGVDYELLTNYMTTITAGQSNTNVQITIFDDANRENTKFFTAVLHSLFSDEIGSLSTTKVYIEDDEVEFVMKTTYFEELESVGAVIIPVTRLGYKLTSGSIEIKLDTSAESVAELETSVLNFAEEVTEANGTLRILDDNHIEDVRTVVVSLSRVEGGVIGSPNMATIRIKDDDSIFQFLQEVFIVEESVGVLPVTILRRGCLQCQAEVEYEIVDSTSSASADDYTVPSGAVQFNSGETQKDIDITITEDDIVEGEEHLVVQLNGQSGTSTTQLIILDNDEEPTPNPDTPGAVLLKVGEFVIEEINSVPVSCTADILDKNSPAYIMLETRIETLLTDVYNSITGFLSVDVYEIYCGSIVVKFSVAIEKDSAGESELESTFRNSLDTNGYIDSSEFRVVPGTTIEFEDVCDDITCNDGGMCVADRSNNRGICICTDGFIGETCELLPTTIMPKAAQTLRLAEILGISLGIIFGVCIFVITISMCWLAVRRASLAKSASTFQCEVPSGRHTYSLPPPIVPSIDITSYFTTYGTHYNPIFQTDEFGMIDIYWGPNRRNLYF